MVGEILADVEQTLKETDPNFRLPDVYQNLIHSAKGNVYPWDGGDFDLQELISPTEDSEEEDDVQPNVAEGSGRMSMS